jgi:hypothetical protein
VPKENGGPAPSPNLAYYEEKNKNKGNNKQQN